MRAPASTASPAGTRRGIWCARVLEGVAFGHRQHIETMRTAGAVFNEAVLSGGGSRSLIWPQIFADVLGVPVSVARSRETGALGAAIAAGTGVGVFSDFGRRCGRHGADGAALSSERLA